MFAFLVCPAADSDLIDTPEEQEQERDKGTDLPRERLLKRRLYMRQRIGGRNAQQPFRGKGDRQFLSILVCDTIMWIIEERKIQKGICSNSRNGKIRFQGGIFFAVIVNLHFHAIRAVQQSIVGDG